MDVLQLKEVPIAKVGMLIRKPSAEVFEAIVNPTITTQFWFTKSSGRLEAGKNVTWIWEMYNHSVVVNIREIEQDKSILMDWGNYSSYTTVKWLLTPFGKDATYLTVINSGFEGDGDKVMKDALDSQGGFTWVVAGLKCFLEHGICLNLIADAFPKGLREH